MLLLSNKYILWVLYFVFLCELIIEYVLFFIFFLYNVVISGWLGFSILIFLNLVFFINGCILGCIIFKFKVFSMLENRCFKLFGIDISEELM